MDKRVLRQVRRRFLDGDTATPFTKNDLKAFFPDALNPKSEVTRFVTAQLAAKTFKRAGGRRVQKYTVVPKASAKTRPKARLKDSANRTNGGDDPGKTLPEDCFPLARLMFFLIVTGKKRERWASVAALREHSGYFAQYTRGSIGFLLRWLVEKGELEQDARGHFLSRSCAGNLEHIRTRDALPALLVLPITAWPTSPRWSTKARYGTDPYRLLQVLRFIFAHATERAKESGRNALYEFAEFSSSGVALWESLRLIDGYSWEEIPSNPAIICRVFAAFAEHFGEVLVCNQGDQGTCTITMGEDSISLMIDLLALDN